MAAATERWLVEGAGARFPEGMSFPAREADRFVFVDDAWPLPFQDRIGEAITLRISEQTGCYEFVDGAGSVFWTVVPVAPLTWDWVSPFRSPDRPATRGLYSPFRLAREWTLVSHAENAESSDGASAAARLPSHAEFAENAEPFLLDLRFVDNPTNLCFTAFSCTETNLLFTAFWPTNDILPEGVLDLYGTSNLLSSSWTLLSSHPATNPPVSFEVERASLPWFDATPPHVHDATCLVSTNIVLSPFDGTTVYTNVVWSCSTNRPPGETGFFRLGTRADTDGDGLTDAFEILVTGSSVHAADTDGDGIPDAEELALGSSPVASDTDGDGIPDLDETGLLCAAPFSWRTSVSATNLLAGLPDGAVATVPLSSPFTADGVEHDRIAVDPHGILFLLGPDDAVTNAFPEPEPLLTWEHNPAHLAFAALWCDLRADEDSELLFFETEDESVVEWRDFLPPIPENPPLRGAGPERSLWPGRITLQVVLPRTVRDTMIVQYLMVPEGGLAAVVGVQNRNRGYFTLPRDWYVLPRPGEPPVMPADLKAFRFFLGFGSNPAAADSDGDGLSDSEELAAGTDLVLADIDRDGLTDPEELEHHTDPHKFDTDGDGVGDGDEVHAGTDPLDADDRVGCQSGALTGYGPPGQTASWTETFALPKGTSALVGLWASSQEYPEYTSEASQYNDTLSWTVSSGGRTVSFGETSVNALHGLFAAADAAETVVEGVPGHPANLDWALVSAPADADATISVAFQVANVGDGRRPSALGVTIHPLKVVQANWPDSPTATDDGERRRKRILRNRVAYVTGEPAAPALTARFVGLPDGVGIGWRLDLTTEREKRKTLDDRRVPFDGFAQTVGETPWDIAAALHEIVGGRAELTVAIDNCPLGTYSFFIRGKNPKDEEVESFIRANVSSPDDDIVLAIARHENRWGQYVYNQFNPGPASYVETLNWGKPSGWGIGQIDRSGTRGGFVTTAEAWDWKVNVVCMINAFMEKVRTQTTFINRFRRTYGADANWVEPDSAYVHVPETAIALPAKTWGGIVLYNGTNGIPSSFADKSTFVSPWKFTPGNGWRFWDNENSYAESISLELFGGNTNALQ